MAVNADIEDEIPEDLTVRGAITKAIEEVSENEGGPPDAQEDAQNILKERLRDEEGRFAREPKQERKTLTLPEKAKGELAAPVVAAEIRAPDSWTPAAKAEFPNLPPNIQQEILKREQDVHKQFTRQDEERNFGRRIRDVMVPYLAIMNAEGATPEQAISSLLNMAYIMRTGSPQQKQQLLYETARQYNVPLQALPAAAQPDPNITALNQRLAQIELQSRQAELNRQQQEDFSLNSEIDAFSQSEGHEHFPAVSRLMGEIMFQDPKINMEKAYEMAVWASPEIRSTLLQSEQAKRVSEARMKADKARRASVSVTGAPSGGLTPEAATNQNESLRDTLRAAYRGATGRV